MYKINPFAAWTPAAHPKVQQAAVPHQLTSSPILNLVINPVCMRGFSAWPHSAPCWLTGGPHNAPCWLTGGPHSAPCWPPDAFLQQTRKIKSFFHHDCDPFLAGSGTTKKNRL